jgi:protein SCO1
MRMSRSIAVLLQGLLVLGLAVRASAQPTPPMSVPPPGQGAAERVPILKDVGIDQHLDAPVPLDLPFVDEHGRDVRLGDYFGKRPVVLALVYYECPMLCTLVLNGMVSSLEALTFTPGQDFEVVAVSFDPGETPALALDKKKTYLTRYGRPGAEGGIHFLTGREDSIRQLTAAVGFRYVYDPAIDQFAHPAAITVLTPAGRVSRYLYGIEYAPKDLRLALVEATDGRIGTAVDQVLLYCYHYDPETGKYGVAIMNVIRLAGILTVGAVGAFVLLTLRRDRASSHRGRPDRQTGNR